MEYIIADIRLSLPDSLIPPRFAEALQVFAVSGSAGEGSGRARAARSEVAPGEAAVRARAAGPEVAPGEAAARARVARSEVGPTVFSEPGLLLKSLPAIPRAAGWHELHRFDFTDADADCRFGCDQAGFLLEMSPRSKTATARFRVSGVENRAWCNLSPAHHPALFRFGLWTLFNLVALHRDAVAIHASAIHYRGRGVLFLGESGTGKSTHSRLWCENIPGSTLLNDDSPILGVSEGSVRVWGSPWSGKVPCYRNESYPVAAIVRLVQAPENRIRRLAPVEAFGALFPSAPPAFLRDAGLRDAVCTLLGKIIEQVPVYRLACRPDAEAARLACETLFGRALSPLRPTPENPDRRCR